MNRQLYTISLYLLSPVIIVYFLYRGIKDPRYLLHFSERLGLLPSQPLASRKLNQSNKQTKTLLIHCASVGEIKASIPLIKRLSQESEFTNLVITNTTPTGREETAKLIQSLSEEKSHGINISNFYLPIDWPNSCQRFLKQLQIDLVVLMETELWPNFIKQCSNKNIPVILANARMSEKSASKYNNHPKLTADIFSGISMIAAQYETDKKQFLTLNIEEAKINCVGSIKFDIKIEEPLKQQQIRLKKSWRKNRHCWIACSIHPGEFSAILSCHKQLLEKDPDLLLIAVPRHPEQFELFKSQVKESNFNFINRSSNIIPNNETQIIVGDTMGELTLLCGAADIAFVGGSLIDRGGHNPLEPAACGLPVIMGESDYNFSDVSQIMQESDTLTLVKNESELISTVIRLLEDNHHLAHKPKIESLFENNGQAINKLTALIVKYLE